eukprot:scaffold85704_cov37-Tisochrysis_lutea.AAC.4
MKVRPDLYFPFPLPPLSALSNRFPPASSTSFICTIGGSADPIPLKGASLDDKCVRLPRLRKLSPFSHSQPRASHADVAVAVKSDVAPFMGPQMGHCAKECGRVVFKGLRCLCKLCQPC